MQRRDHDSFESTQTEYLTALEVSCLNSMYLSLGGIGVCVWREDYWQEPVMEWKIEKIEPAVTTVLEESF